MLRAARDHGLRILEEDGDYYREHGNVDDKLYDSRAGMGVFYRWKPREIQSLCELQKGGSPAVIHLSALERIAHGTDGYNPGTLPREVNVTFTPSFHRDAARARDEDEAAGLRAKALETALQRAFAERGASLGAVKHTLTLGCLSYYLMLGRAWLSWWPHPPPETDSITSTPWVLPGMARCPRLQHRRRSMGSCNQRSGTAVVRAVYCYRADNCFRRVGLARDVR